MFGSGSLADFCRSFREGAGVLMPGRKSRPAEKLCLSLAGAFKNPLNLKTRFLPADRPPPRRRETYRYRRSLHMLIFTYEDDIKIKNYHVEVISRTFYLSTETISRLPNLVRLSLSGKVQYICFHSCQR
jgi:hypothetical protein